MTLCEKHSTLITQKCKQSDLVLELRLKTAFSSIRKESRTNFYRFVYFTLEKPLSFWEIPKSFLLRWGGSSFRLKEMFKF